MVRKIAFSDDHIITVEESGRIRVYRACDSTVGALREIAEQNDFDIDSKWTARTFACKLIKFLNEKYKQKNDELN